MFSNLIKNIFKIGSAGIILLTFLAYLCPEINPKVFPWLSFAGTGFPWLLIANVIMLGFWLWRWDRYALYHLGIIILGWHYIERFVGLNLDKSKVPENAISITTHNLGSTTKDKKSITDAYRIQKVNAYAQFLQENGFPDILCTQETGSTFYHLLAEKLNYPHTFNLKKGTVIFSRFPMEAGGDIPFSKSNNSIVWVDIRTNKGLVRVYNAHLQSNKVTSQTEKILEEGELKEEETWGEIGGVLGQVGKATRIRAQQAAFLRDHIDRCPHPIILCGDFNDTPNSYVYRILSEPFKDTFREKGLGLGSTFGGALPFLRIDYILTAPKIKIYACKRVESDFSDHYPVFVEVGL
jgi:endonuclease/exonuclease/phosphatase family metal-dependent hydrolase